MSTPHGHEFLQNIPLKVPQYQAGLLTCTGSCPGLGLPVALHKTLVNQAEVGKGRMSRPLGSLTADGGMRMRRAVPVLSALMNGCISAAAFIQQCGHIRHAFEQMAQGSRQCQKQRANCSTGFQKGLLPFSTRSNG